MEQKESTPFVVGACVQSLLLSEFCHGFIWSLVCAGAGKSIEILAPLEGGCGIDVALIVLILCLAK